MSKTCNFPIVIKSLCNLLKNEIARLSYIFISIFYHYLYRLQTGTQAKGFLLVDHSMATKHLLMPVYITFKRQMAYSKMLFSRRDMYFIYNFNVQNSHSRCLQNLPEEKAGGNFGPNSSVVSTSCFDVGNEEMPESVVEVTLSMEKTKTCCI